MDTGSSKQLYLHVFLQLVNGHWEVWVVVVVQRHIATGLVQHGEQRTQAAQAGEVHDVLHLGRMFQGLDDQACRGEVGLQDGRSVALDLR